MQLSLALGRSVHSFNHISIWTVCKKYILIKIKGYLLTSMVHEEPLKSI